MLEIGQKVQFKEGAFTQAIGKGITFTVTDAFVKGDETPSGETYNGSTPLYRIVTDDAAVPEPLRILYETEDSVIPV